MKKKLLFSMAAISILVVGLMIWSCGDDGGTPSVDVTIELAAAQETINADDSYAGTTITITAEVTGGSNVAFEITEKPTGSTASVPAAGVAVANGEATELSAGTVTGTIVVTGTVGSESAEVAVTVTAGAKVGIIKGPIGVLTCPEPPKIAFPTQLVDAFDNPVPEAGVSVTFTADAGGPVTLTPTVNTDGSGQATAGLLLAEGLTAVVTAIYINGVTFDMVTGEDRLLIPPNAAEIEDREPPSFRTNTAIIDPDTDGNILGLVGFLVNEDLDGAMKDGTVNLIYATMELVAVSDVNDIMFVGVTGLCGAPAGPSTIPCTGTQTDYYIDPDSLDECDYPLIFAKGTVTDGALLVTLGELELSFPVEDEIIPLKLCDVEVAGTVTEEPWAIAGNIVEGTYCPAPGCASLSGVITVDELCFLVDAALGAGMCDIALGLLGDTDGDCLGDPAYSMRLLFKANEIYLYEAP